MPENKDFFHPDIDALIYFPSLLYWVGASLVAQIVKNLPEMWEIWVGKILWKREWLHTLVFLPGEFHGQRSLAIYSPWGGKESDMTEWLHFHFHFIPYKLDQLIRSIRRYSPILAFQDFMQLFSFTYLSLSWVCKFNHISFVSFYFFQKFHGILHHYGLSPISLSLSCGIMAGGKTMNFVCFYYKTI